MKFSIFPTICSAVFACNFVLPAAADQIDEKQKELMSKINVASQTNLVSPKDISEIRKEMSAFDDNRRQLKAAHSDTLSGDDEIKLDTELNAIIQHFDKCKQK